MKSTSEKAKIQTLKQVSAGGVAFRLNDSDYEIAIISVNPSRRWQLPKGLIDAGETPETAALREVREEAGIVTELIAPIEIVEYWYVGEERRGDLSRREERVRRGERMDAARQIGVEDAQHDP